jgi:hypothetical protein
VPCMSDSDKWQKLLCQMALKVLIFIEVFMDTMYTKITTKNVKPLSYHKTQ